MNARKKIIATGENYFFKNYIESLNFVFKILCFYVWANSILETSNFIHFTSAPKRNEKILECNNFLNIAIFLNTPRGSPFRVTVRSYTSREKKKVSVSAKKNFFSWGGEIFLIVTNADSERRRSLPTPKESIKEQNAERGGGEIVTANCPPLSS